jgi:hypothetical protein
MSGWEYRSVTVYYEQMKAPGSRDKVWWWNATIDGTHLLGLGDIMNAYGAHGWEAVSAIPTEWQDPGGAVAYGPQHIRAVTLVFKRPLKSSETDS